MKDFFTLSYKFSESHLVFPQITIAILVVLGGLIVLQQVIKTKRSDHKKRTFKFFVENFDKLKLFGTIFLLIAYVYLLDWIGFLFGTIVFMVLINLLFMGNLKRKSILISMISSVFTSFAVWFIFGQLFNITLP